MARVKRGSGKKILFSYFDDRCGSWRGQRKLIRHAIALSGRIGGDRILIKMLSEKAKQFMRELYFWSKVWLL